MKPRVLIIDDEEGIRSSLKMIFEYEGYEVLLAANGPAGLKMAEKEDVDLVFLDIKMPQMDGLDVLKRIKAEQIRINAARARDSDLPYAFEPFDWPALGPISGVYGSQRILNGQPRSPHFGVDIAAPRGTPLKAPAGGIVSLADSDLFFTGGTIIIDHGHGLASLFAHMDKVAVKRAVLAVTTRFPDPSRLPPSWATISNTRRRTRCCASGWLRAWTGSQWRRTRRER